MRWVGKGGRFWNGRGEHVLSDRASTFGRERSASLHTKRRAASVGLGTWMALALTCTTGGCAAHEAPSTAGNRQIDYFGALQVGKLDTAYGWLCESTKQAVSREDFVSSGGQVLTPGWDPKVNGMEGGPYERVFDPDTEREDVVQTEVEAILKRENLRSTWRISMRKEDGQWHLCEFKRLG